MITRACALVCVCVCARVCVLSCVCVKLLGALANVGMRMFGARARARACVCVHVCVRAAQPSISSFTVFFH